MYSNRIVPNHLFRFERMELWSHIRPILNNHIEVDSFILFNPYVNVYMDGQTFNFDDLIERFSVDPDTTQKSDAGEKEPMKPWTFDIGPLKD